MVQHFKSEKLLIFVSAYFYKKTNTRRCRKPERVGKIIKTTVYQSM